MSKKFVLSSSMLNSLPRCCTSKLLTSWINVQRNRVFECKKKKKSRKQTPPSQQEQRSSLLIDYTHLYIYIYIFIIVLRSSLENWMDLRISRKHQSTPHQSWVRCRDHKTHTRAFLAATTTKEWVCVHLEVSVLVHTDNGGYTISLCVWVFCGL